MTKHFLDRLGYLAPVLNVIALIMVAMRLLVLNGKTFELVLGCFSIIVAVAYFRRQTLEDVARARQIIHDRYNAYIWLAVAACCLLSAASIR